jgi:hypothetical protein
MPPAVGGRPTFRLEADVVRAGEFDSTATGSEVG